MTDASENKGPLKDIRVIEMGQLIAGPFAGKTLAEFGADVIKIEPPGAGDPLRNWRLIKEGTSVWWQVQSRNKRSVALDLRSPEGQDIVARNHFRPRDKAILETYADQFPEVRLFNIDDVFGGWREAQEKHFNDGGIYDRIFSAEASSAPR